MINIRTLRKIADKGGLTLKDGRPIEYKTGYQVATHGVELIDINQVMRAVKRYGGNCGLWLENGVWYVDCSIRVATKRDALAIGRACNQISVYSWVKRDLVYC